MPNFRETRVCLAYATRNKFVNYQAFALLFDVHKSTNPEFRKRNDWSICPTMRTGVLSQSIVGPQQVSVSVSIIWKGNHPEKENERQTEW